MLNMKLKSRKFSILAMVVVAIALSGCATYRTDSNIPSQPASSVIPQTNVLILEGIPDTKYKELGPIEVSVKKLTVFHKDPTKDQANEALAEKARIIGANAVINVTYKSGIGFTTWGYIDAKGTGVKLDE
jgi:Putative heavy-metal-binding